MRPLIKHVSLTFQIVFLILDFEKLSDSIQNGRYIEGCEKEMRKCKEYIGKKKI